MKHDIIIVTFKERFELFKNLVESIRKYNTTSNIIVSVNGNINAEFDEAYRAQLYDFLKNIPKTFIRMWPEFRGLSKTINDCIISSTTDYVLYISDDAIVISEKFFDDVNEGIEKYKGMFIISSAGWDVGSGSFIVINIHQMYDLGYYDERLLAIGKEDADIMMRYQMRYNTKIPTHHSEHVQNIISNITQDGYQKNIDGANINSKYRSDPIYPLLNLVIFDEKLKRGNENFQQYPYERFYRLNKHQIVHYDGKLNYNL